MGPGTELLRGRRLWPLFHVQRHLTLSAIARLNAKRTETAREDSARACQDNPVPCNGEGSRRGIAR